MRGRRIWRRKMAESADKSNMCSSCFSRTKYSCLKCRNNFCMRCSVFENDEDTPGWRAGKSVAHCEVCFEEKMKNQQERGACDSDGGDETAREREPTTNTSVSSSSRVKNADESDDDEEHDEQEDEAAGDVDEGERNPLSHFVKKSKGKKKKPGRRSAWRQEEVDDLVDIIINNHYYQRKLIFENTKKQRNGLIYGSILPEMKKRVAERDAEFKFNISQMRTRFKKCVSDCKNAALTIKTATGIRRFQEDQGYGKWFQALFALVKTRHSCQPEQAIEPSSAENSKSVSDELDDSASGTDLFVPVKKNKREKPKSQIGDAIAETLDLVKEVVRNDPAKDLINFFRVEMEKSREHELKLFQLMQNSISNTSFTTHQQQGSTGMNQTMPQPVGMPHMEEGHMAGGYNPQWYGGYVPRPATPTQSMPSTSNDSFCGGDLYKM